MALDLTKLRARLAQPEQNPTNKPSGDGALYPFWNIPVDGKDITRFLEDGNQDNNSSFWVLKQMINLTFPYVIGAAERKPIKMQVPCIEMWNANVKDGNAWTGETGLKCTVMAELQKWYDTALKESGGDKERAKKHPLSIEAGKYWKKPSYIFQGFIRSSALKEENVPENPIRRLVITPQLFKVLRAGLASDPDLNPNEFDFIIHKTTQGDNANYTTSAWARKPSPLTQDEQAAISKYGLFNLSNYLPKRPDQASLNAIMEMFEASVEGHPYDPNKWSQYYKPWNLNTETTSNISTSAAVKEAVSEGPPDDEPVVESKVETSAKGTKSTQQLLAELRAKKAAQ